jgi:hypothetical protein
MRGAQVPSAMTRWTWAAISSRGANHRLESQYPGRRVLHRVPLSHPSGRRRPFKLPLGELALSRHGHEKLCEYDVIKGGMLRLRE